MSNSITKMREAEMRPIGDKKTTLGDIVNKPLDVLLILEQKTKPETKTESNGVKLIGQQEKRMNQEEYRPITFTFIVLKRIYLSHDRYIHARSRKFARIRK